VISDVTAGISGMRSTLAETCGPSRLDDAARMEAALAMTQLMSQGGSSLRDPTGQFAAEAAAISTDADGRGLRRHRCRRNHHPWRRKQLHRQTGHEEQDLSSSMFSSRSKSIQPESVPPDPRLSSLPDVVRLSSVSAGGAEAVGSSAARVLAYEHRGVHSTPAARDGSAVDTAELRRMTQEVLDRHPEGSQPSTVSGKFIRTCSHWNNTTEAAFCDSVEPCPTSQRPKFKFYRTCGRWDNTTDGPEPSPASQFTFAVTKERQASKDGRRRSVGLRRSSLDEVERRRAARSALGPVLARQSSDPSERRRSPPPTPTIRPGAVSLSNGLLRYPDGSSLHHAERPAILNGILPLPALGEEGTPCWGLVPLSVLNVGPYGSAFQLTVPRMVALHEEECLPPSSFTPVRLSFGEPDVVAAASTVHSDKRIPDFATDRRTAPTLVPMSTATDRCENAILEAMQSVKVEDQIRAESEMEVEPLDLTRSAPDLAATNGGDHLLPRGSKYDLSHGRSSSYGSLSALKAFYDDPQMRSGSKKMRSGSTSPPVADAAVIGRVEATPCEPETVDLPADRAEMEAIPNNRNADVSSPVAWRSEFRPRPNQNAVTSTSSSLSAQTAFERVAKEANRDENWIQGTADSLSTTTEPRIPRISKHDSAGLDDQLTRSTGDATNMGSKTEAVWSSAEKEKRLSEGALRAEASNRSRNTPELRDSPPTVKIPANEQTVEENGFQKDRDRIIEETISKTGCAVDIRPDSRDNLSSPSLPRSRSSLNGSDSTRNNLDLIWRLPLKKRRMLDPPVLPPVESSETQSTDSATVDGVDDRLSFSGDNETAADETQQASPAEREYTKNLSMSSIGE